MKPVIPNQKEDQSGKRTETKSPIHFFSGLSYVQPAFPMNKNVQTKSSGLQTPGLTYTYNLYNQLTDNLQAAPQPQGQCDG